MNTNEMNNTNKTYESMAEIAEATKCRYEYCLENGLGYISVFCDNADPLRVAEHIEKSVKDAGGRIHTISILPIGYQTCVCAYVWNFKGETSKSNNA